MTAYYNEIDPFAVATLRELIKAGHIAPGIVDDRSIEDVTPSDLSGFDQCHFFAGFGVWSYALRRAGWPDSRRVWTASCPCQPFSAAGQGAGFADERHLWPHLHYLASIVRPDAILGEQVASKDAGPWIDLVHTDMEAMGYAFGAVPFPSAGVGAPHIRDRLYWVAYAIGARICRESRSIDSAETGARDRQHMHDTFASVTTCGLGDDDDARLERLGHRYNAPGGWIGAVRPVAASGEFGRVEHHRHNHDASEINAASVGQSEADRPTDQPSRSGVSSERVADNADERFIGRRSDEAGNGRDTARVESERLRITGSAPTTGPTNGFWSDADWLYCRDDKWRPVEPGTFPLVDGAPARVGRLRGYGNAINAIAAQAFIESCM